MLFSSRKQLLSAANVKEEGVGQGRQWPFYQGRWPFYHASLKRLSNSAVAKSLDLEHGWQILPFPV